VVATHPIAANQANQQCKVETRGAYAYGNLYLASKRARNSGSVTRAANAVTAAVACI
jgi:hypothetical protein